MWPLAHGEAEGSAACPDVATDGRGAGPTLVELIAEEA